jgi:hypothetical protein
VSRPRTTSKRAGLPNRRGATLAAAALAALALSATPAQATLPGFDRMDGTPSTTQAGGHPDVQLNITYRQDYQAGHPLQCESEDATTACVSTRSFRIHWPTGFIGNPHVTPLCTLTEFNQAACPANSQIGKVAIIGQENGNIQIGWFPLYNMETRPDQAGLLAFVVPLYGAPVFLDLSARTDGDYGLEAVSSPQIPTPFREFQTTLWGVPQSPAHDFERFVTPLTGLALCIQGPEFGEDGCFPSQGFTSPTHAKSTIPEAPFLQNPTTCGVPLTLSADIEYSNGLEGHAEAPWPATTGCNQASFDPSVVVKPTTSQAETASGIDADLRVPQTQSAGAPAPSELRTSIVTLPKGFSINPAAADGKMLCPNALSAIGTLLAATCPEYSKIGTLMLDVAALPAPIPGSLYLAQSLPGDPYRILLAADGFATHVKLLGSAKADPTTGRVSLVFEDLPQSPLQEFQLHIFGSERGVLATPEKCGTYPVEAKFIPWNNALNPRDSLSFITIDSGPAGTPCPNGPRPFAPRLAAGAANNTAGFYSPFSFFVAREDAHQYLTGLTVKTPPGFSASLRGIPYCSEAAISSLAAPGHGGVAEQSSSACPAASRVGTVAAAAGPGTRPLNVTGRVYLAGPYKGAPLSLLVVVPAVSGPYDLGNVAVRVAIRVDPITAAVTADSAPVPQIFGGIPLRVRDIRVDLDRPNFAINPTNCDPFSVDATVTGNEGASSDLANRFQVGNCDELAYAPKLSIRLSGGINRRGHPAIHAVLRNAPGEANSKTISTTLPKGELLDNSHIGTVCTRVDFANDSCPKGALVGRAEVTTPLLDQPLKGFVYLRSSSHQLPDLALDLEGQIDIETAGHVDSVNGRLRTTFVAIPDVPVSKIVLDLAGGAKGLLQNARPICGSGKKANVKMIGQNGAQVRQAIKLQASCRKGARHKRAGSKHA